MRQTCACRWVEGEAGGRGVGARVGGGEERQVVPGVQPCPAAEAAAQDPPTTPTCMWDSRPLLLPTHTSPHTTPTCTWGSRPRCRCARGAAAAPGGRRRPGPHSRGSCHSPARKGGAQEGRGNALNMVLMQVRCISQACNSPLLDLGFGDYINIPTTSLQQRPPPAPSPLLLPPTALPSPS